MILTVSMIIRVLEHAKECVDSIDVPFCVAKIVPLDIVLLATICCLEFA